MVEKKTIVKIVFVRFREAWYRLSPEERLEKFDTFRDKWNEIGMKALMQVNCSWSCEEWTVFAIEEHLDIESLQEYQNWLIEHDWPRYLDSKIYLGTKLDAKEMLKIFVMP